MERILCWVALVAVLLIACPAASVMLLAGNRDYFRGLSDDLRSLLET